MQGSTKSAVGSAFWTVAESFSLTVVSAITLFIAARYLSTADFGRASVALGIVQIASTFVEKLFHDAIIQRKELSPRELASAHIWTLIVAVAVSLLLVGFAPYLSLALGGDGGVDILQASSVAVLLTGLSAVRLAQYRRDLRFKDLAYRSVSARCISACAVVFMAVNGFGAWSLVGQQILLVGLSSAWLMLRRDGYSFELKSGRLDDVKDLWRLGLSSSIIQLSFIGLPRAYLAGFSARYGIAEAGLLSFAFRLVDMLRDVLGAAASQFALPMFSKLKREHGYIDKAYCATTKYSCYLGFPIFAGLGLYADLVLQFLFGERWLPAEFYVSCLSCLCLYSFWRMFSMPAFLAEGLVWPPFVNVAVQALSLALLWYLAPDVSAQWAIAFWALRFVPALPIDVLLLQRLVRIPCRSQFASIGMPVSAVAIATVISWSVRYFGETLWPWLDFGAAVLFLFVYLACLRVLARDDFGQIGVWLAERFKSRGK